MASNRGGPGDSDDHAVSEVPSKLEAESSLRAVPISKFEIHELAGPNNICPLPQHRLPKTCRTALEPRGS